MYTCTYVVLHLYTTSNLHVLLCSACCAQEVVIQKQAREKLGLSIKGGAKESRGNPLDYDDDGIFISKVQYHAFMRKFIPTRNKVPAGIYGCWH